jgi:alkanesulfonate monooxygenase SsuD/methylene tetrahydromethanopterin reductase-like flavin-dependent oxidoreductase (luciferase family)
VTAPRDMRFGYMLAGQFLPEEDPQVRLREALEQVRVAKQAGFHSIWVTQHFLADFQYLQPVPFLARLVAEADGMHVGTSVLLVTMYPPILLAEELATLDVISGGRFILGAGTAYRKEEFEAFGIPWSERVSRFDEALEVMRKLWSGDVVNHAGTYTTLKDTQMRLLPVQRDAIPVWVGATGPNGIAHAAVAGDEWLISPELPLSAVLERKEIYAQALPNGISADSKTYPLLREAFVSKDRRTATGIAETALRTKYAAYERWGHSVGSFEAMADSTFMLGDADFCLDQVRTYRKELGTSFIATRMQWPGLEQRDVLTSIDGFADVIAASEAE